MDETCISHSHTDFNIFSAKNGGQSNTYGTLAAKELVHEAMLKKIAQIDVDTCQPGEENAFYVADMGEIYRQHLRWKMNLGRVKPFYGEPRLPTRFASLLISTSGQVQPRP